MPSIRSHLPTIGVLGGMGPAATADFYRKLVEATPAQRDQDHLPVLIHSVPQIPDRASSYLHGAPSPLPMLARFARELQASGAQAIVMPCNTAHLWYDELRDAVEIPILHIVDSVLEALRDCEVRTIGVIGTGATLAGQLYPRRSRTMGRAELRWIEPTAIAQQSRVTPGIEAVKAGRIEQARGLLQPVARELVEHGAQALVLACTEIPLVLGDRDTGVATFDATQLLAEATVRWAIQHSPPAAAGASA